MAIKSLLLCVLCLVFCFPCPAGASALVQDSPVFRLSRSDLVSICDPALTRDIRFTDEGFTLSEGALTGTYVTQSVTMPEFTMISLSGVFVNSCEADQPRLAMSVYRPQEDAWSPFIDLPDGENAHRDKGNTPTVPVRFCVTLNQVSGSPAPVFCELIVTGGDHFFTKENIILAFVMFSAAGVLLFKKKRLAKTGPVPR